MNARSISILVLACHGAAAAACKDNKSENAAGATSARATASAAPVKKVRFRQLPAEVGQKRHTTRKSSFKISVEFWSENERFGTREKVREEKLVRHEEVLGLVGAAPAKVKVTYEEHRLKEDQWDKAPRDGNPLEGKAYIIDATEPEMKITDAEGKPVSDDEIELLKVHHSRLGDVDPAIELITRHPWPLGKKYPLQIKLFEALVGTRGEYEKGYITLRRIENKGGAELAHFDWTAKMKTQEGAGLTVQWDLTGHTVVEVSPARIRDNDVEAFLEASGRTKRDGVWVKMQGSGSLDDERETRYGE